ncbi:MAG TPA: sigma-54 dependent transcriptional regulator, partial [Terriglobales bacterium]|nr:sigma-54 dependent transcriptional regulator [Terriglobales bacterium]
PMVTVNAGGLAEGVFESELFGHVKGAFTDAKMDRVGRFELADGGTLFLDEIANVPLNLQAKLLRVLQQREFVRLGGTQAVKVDVRLIAASNQDLRAAAEQGRFRKDLFFRLNVVTITMPALRERGEDIALLAHYFLSRCNQRCNRRVREISPAAMVFLKNYDWPGNVRELENAIEHAILLGASNTVMPEDLPEVILEAQPAVSDPTPGYHAALGELKRKLIVEAVQQARGNYTEAARLLGLHPNYLHRLIRNLNLKATLNAGAERAAS